MRQLKNSPGIAQTVIHFLVEGYRDSSLNSEDNSCDGQGLCHLSRWQGRKQGAAGKETERFLLHLLPRPIPGHITHVKVALDSLGHDIPSKSLGPSMRLK